MDQEPTSSTANNSRRTARVLVTMAVLFFGLAAAFLADLWGHSPAAPRIPLVDKSFLETTPWRKSYMDLVRNNEDLSDFDCYACHDKKKPLVLAFDANNALVIPEEHKNIVMGHGTNNRNNLCFNCHNATNLKTLQIRDGHDLSFSDSPQLCGSCHGPTYRDWDAGAHGRISGYWDRSQGKYDRLACVNCHNPHSPRIPTRVPAPGPHAMRTPIVSTAHSETTP
jgi:hypothetical protein